jgi:hypothetical protein
LEVEEEQRASASANAESTTTNQQNHGECEQLYKDKENCKDLLFAIAYELKKGDWLITKIDEELYRPLEDTMVKR